MGEVYSHLSEEERQVIQIEIGNGTGIRAIGAMIGRSPSTVSREIKRNTWFPSNESESYRPYRPKRLKTGPWTGRYYIAGPAQRKADRRRAKPRKPYRLSCGRLWSRVAEWPGRGWSPLPARCGIVELSRQARHFHRCVPLPVRPFFFIARPHAGHFFALLDGVLTPSSPPPGAHLFPRGEKDMPTRLLVQGQTSIINTTKAPIGPTLSLLAHR